MDQMYDKALYRYYTKSNVLNNYKSIYGVYQKHPPISFRGSCRSNYGPWSSVTYVSAPVSTCRQLRPCPRVTYGDRNT